LIEDDLPFDYYSSAVFSPDGKYIAASHYHGFVRIWDVRTGQLLRNMKSSVMVYDIAFTPDGKGLLRGGENGALKYWDLSSLPTRFSRSQMKDDFLGHVPAAEEQSQPEREFSGHTVGSISFGFRGAHCYPFYRASFSPLPSPLMADGLYPARLTTASASGTPPTGRCNVSSTMIRGKGRLMLVQQAVISLLGDIMVR